MQLAPHVLTALRLLSAPLLWWLIGGGALGWALALLVLAMISDYADGQIARRWGRPSTAGAYFDVVADFAVIVAVFAGLAAGGALPPWLPILIAAAFALFLATSRAGPTIYDPVGRYVGALLFSAAALALAVPLPAVMTAVLWVSTAALIATIAARAAYVAGRA
jgi:phosphatidylglycerophosphate synthase